MTATRTWEWKGGGAFNPRYDATITAEGLEYGCEIQGPFCGYDAQGTQTWAEFLEAGPPEKIQMPANVAAEIREHARAAIQRPT